MATKNKIKFKNRHKLSVRELVMAPSEEDSLRIMQHSVVRAFPNKADRIKYLDNLIEDLEKDIPESELN